MDVKNKIREAFKKKRTTLKEAAGDYDPTTQPNLYELSNFLRKSGYRLISVDKDNRENVIEVLLKPLNSGYLYPDILHDVTDNNFYIDVTTHGLLVASDVEDIITGYENAVQVVKHLESIDLEDLEIDTEEVDDEE